MASRGFARTNGPAARLRHLVFYTAAACAAAVSLYGAPQPQADAPPYFPPRGAWAAREPGALGLDGAKLAEAVAYAQANENPNDRDLFPIRLQGRPSQTPSIRPRSR